MAEESRINATDRLRQEGRWNEASAFRDQTKRQLQAEGKTRLEANDGAWAAMLAKYPPLAPSADADEYADACWIEDPDGSHDDARWPNLVGDILWVYVHLAVRRIQPTDAPNPGAWSLLCWARRHVNRFFEQLFPKILSASAQQSWKPPIQHAGAGDDEDDGLQRLNAIFAEARQQNEERRQEETRRPT